MWLKRHERVSPDTIFLKIEELQSLASERGIR
jgi:hypothetical protein